MRTKVSGTSTNGNLKGIGGRDIIVVYDKRQMNHSRI